MKIVCLQDMNYPLTVFKIYEIMHVKLPRGTDEQYILNDKGEIHNLRDGGWFISLEDWRKRRIEELGV